MEQVWSEASGGVSMKSELLMFSRTRQDDRRGRRNFFLMSGYPLLLDRHLVKGFDFLVDRFRQLKRIEVLQLIFKFRDSVGSSAFGMEDTIERCLSCSIETPDF